MADSFKFRSETLVFAAADTVKISGLPFSEMGFPFTHIRFTKSGGVTAATLTLSAGIGRAVMLSVVEAGAETILAEAFLSGSTSPVVIGTLWHDVVQVAAATNITGGALVQGGYIMALSF